MVIGKQGSLLEEIKKETLWVPQVQRSPAIKSQIVENIREVLYANNNYRRKFLNSIGKKIYTDWNPDKTDEWARLTFLGAARQVGRSCFLLQTPNSRILLDCGVDVSSNGENKFPYFNIPEFDINQLDAVIKFHIHNNNLYGIIPDSICDLDISKASDYWFKINYNYFCPPYPDCIKPWNANQNQSKCE